MKKLLLLHSIYLGLLATAQNKLAYNTYDKLIEVKGTPYVIATVSTWGKAASEASHILFINTTNGDQQRADFPLAISSRQINHIRIDKYNVNLVLVSAKSVDLDNKNGVGWADPTQLILFTPDGKQRIQITDDRFFSETWVVNEETGRLIVTGHYDSNMNGRYDKSDKDQMLIYDLAARKLVYQL